jgi:subtilisin-like proprotein convertase family protein
MVKFNRFLFALVSIFPFSTLLAQDCDDVFGELEITGYSNLDGGYYQVCQHDTILISLINEILPEGESNYNYLWTIGALEVTTETPSLTYIAQQGGMFEVSLEVSLPSTCSKTFLLSSALSTVAYPVLTNTDQVTACVYSDLVLEGTYFQPVISSSLISSAQGWPIEDLGTITLNYEILSAIPGSTIENCSDLISINSNMEHSYLGDLFITITCPNGTSVILYDESGSGTFLGEPIDDDDLNIIGVGYDYSWSQNSTLGDMNVGGFVEELPTGVYLPIGNLCDLVGCPINGTWSLTVSDMMTSDSGYLFSWGITLDESVFISDGDYLTTVNDGPLDTFWLNNGEGFIDENLDLLIANSSEGGITEYTYHVQNSAGCSTEKLTQVEIEIPQDTIFVNAGNDIVADNLFFQLNGEVSSPPQCTGEVLEQYCLDNNASFVTTFDPQTYFGCDQPVLLTIESGTLQEGFDYVNFYDGPSNQANFIGQFDGNLEGLGLMSSHPTGSITLEFFTDGSNSCADGNQLPIEIKLFNFESVEYDYFWSPSTGLNSPYILNPLITDPFPTEYVLTAYYPNSPSCIVTDTVNVLTENSIFNTTIFHDINENGVQEPYEPGLQNIGLASESIVSYSSLDGSVNLPLNYGTSEIYLLYDTQLYTPTTPTSQIIVADELTSIINGDPIGLLSTNPDISGSINIFKGLAECEENEYLFVDVFHTGNTTFSGQLKLVVDPQVTVISSDNFPEIDQNIYTYQLNEFAPGEFRTILLHYSTPLVGDIAPILSFSAELKNGNAVLETANFTYVVDCENTEINLTENSGLGELGLVLPESILEYSLEFSSNSIGELEQCTIQMPLSEYFDLSSIAVSSNYPILSTYILADNTLQISTPYTGLDFDNNIIYFSAKLSPNAIPGTLIEHTYTVLYDDYTTTTSNLESNLVMDCETQPVIIYQDANNPAYYYTNVTGADINWYNNGELIAQNVPFVFVNFSGNLTATASLDGACEMISAPVIVTNMDEINASSAISLFPNPTSNSFTWNSKENITGIEVYNSLGQRIFQNTNILTNQVSTSDWAVGTYHVVMETTSGLRFHQSLVVSR